MEIQVTAKYFIGTFTREHHFYTHGMNFSCQQIHRRGRAYGCDIVGFDVVDHLIQRIQAFLQGKFKAVVDRTDVRGHLGGGREIRRAFQTDRKRVQTRPPGRAAFIVLYPHTGVFLGDCGNNGGIQTAG